MRRNLLSPKVYVPVIIIIVAAIVLYLLLHYRNPTPLAIKQGVSQPSSTTTGSHKNITPHTVPQGGAKDNQGRVGNSGLPPESSWTTSSTGKITLQTPVANSVVRSGDQLIGRSNSSAVGFVLLDNKVGQIASGQLDVVNNQFSGTLQFTPHASNGTLQLYSPNPTNGAEENFLSIPVKFVQ